MFPDIPRRRLHILSSRQVQQVSSQPSHVFHVLVTEVAQSGKIQPAVLSTVCRESWYWQMVTKYSIMFDSISLLREIINPDWLFLASWPKYFVGPHWWVQYSQKNQGLPGYSDLLRNSPVRRAGTCLKWGVEIRSWITQSIDKGWYI